MSVLLVVLSTSHFYNTTRWFVALRRRNGAACLDRWAGSRF